MLNEEVGRLDSVIQNGLMISAYTYDSNSNRLSHVTPGGTITGSFDAQDRLLSYGSVTYSYNSFGDLTSKTESGQSTQYVYDAQGNLLRVDLPDGDVIEYLIEIKQHFFCKLYPSFISNLTFP